VYCFVSPVLNFGSAKGFAPHTHFAYVSIEVIVVMAFGNHKVGASSSIDNSSLRTGNIFQLAIYIKINAGYIIAIQYCGYVVPISVIYYRGTHLKTTGYFYAKVTGTIKAEQPFFACRVASPA